MMIRIIILSIALFFCNFIYAQNAKEIEKWTGLIGNQKCTLQYTISEKEGKNGQEPSVTYKGWIQIGTKKIPLQGWYEGNSMRFDEVLNGKKTYTIYFDLSSGHDGQFELIGKRTIKNKGSVIKLNRVK
jgi:hypothetical protein